ncbi:MAG: phosphotransferase [Pseudomonadota bacterium]
MSFFDGRDDLRRDFLKQNGWADASAALIAQDWAARRYWRLSSNDNTRILMESVPDNHPDSTPGHKISDMVKIGQWLSSIGLHVPDIESVDQYNGFVLLEDIGSQTLPLQIEPYETALEVLQKIHIEYHGNALDLPSYKGSRVDEGKRRIIEQLLPLIRGSKNNGDEVSQYLKIWGEIEANLPDCPQTFLHIDYHAENIMWLPDDRGIRRCGILDYQGAHYGPLPYDLTNLLEDIRRDVSADMKDALLSRFCEDISTEEKEIFKTWYKVLALQFHCRVAGQLIKLFQIRGDQKHLEYMPRVFGYLKNELSAFPALQSLFNDLGFDFDIIPEITPDRISDFVAQDAF